MSNVAMGIVAIVVAYLIGGIPFGYLLVRFTSGNDVRESGSGNIGATNVLRTAGKGVAIATLLLDVVKGVVAVWLASRLTDNNVTWMSLAALAVMAGHAFPVFLKFKGGKAVASFTGAFLFLTPLPLLSLVPVFVLMVAISRYISAASILGAAMFPFGVWLILHPPPIVVIVALIAGAFIIYRHKENIVRLHAGVENKFRWNKS